MHPGGKTVVIPGSGGVVILSPGLDTPALSFPDLGGTTAEDAASDDPRPPAPRPADEVEIFPAPFLSPTSPPTAGRQGAHPFRPLDAYTATLTRSAPPTSVSTTAVGPPEGAIAAASTSQAGANDATPWYARAWSALTSAVGSLFGSLGTPPPPDPSWERIREPVKQEIAHLRTLGNGAARKAYLRAAGDEIIARIMARHGTAEIGFHYNLHGGRPEDYLALGGITATMGDIALQYSMFGANLNYSVYFFRSSQMNLYDILDEGDPAVFFFPSRMGSALVLFRLDSDYLRQALAEGGAFNPSSVSIDFDPTWIESRNGGRRIGIPADTFLTSPLEVFHRVGRHLGFDGWLSRDEETLAVMRHIEAAATASPPAAAPAVGGAPPLPPDTPPLTLFRRPLDLYHTTPVAEGRNILAHGFVAAQIDEEGTTTGVFHPAGYTGPPVAFERKDVIPQGGSGIYFGLSGDDTWRGGGLGLWSLGWEGRFEIRVHVPADSGLRIVDLRDPQNHSYAMQWARDHRTGWPLEEKAVDRFAAEHDIDILIRRGRTGRDSYEEVVFKTPRAYAYLNGLPREGLEPSSLDADKDY